MRRKYLPFPSRQPEPGALPRLIIIAIMVILACLLIWLVPA